GEPLEPASDESRETAAVGADPELAVPALENRGHAAGGKSLGGVEALEPRTARMVERVRCPEPPASGLVVVDRPHGSGDPPGGRLPRHPPIVLPRGQSVARAGQQ